MSLQETLDGPRALMITVSVETLLTALISPLMGAGIAGVELRAAMRRVVEDDRLWETMHAILRQAGPVAAAAAAEVGLSEAQRGSVS